MKKKQVKGKAENRIREKCKLCQGRLQFLFEANHCRMAKCPACGFVQMIDEDKTPEYEYTKSYFVSSKYKDDSALAKEHARRKQLVGKYLKRGTLLDYGCATGEFVSYVSDVYQVEGCDISKDAIEIAGKKYRELSGHFFHISELGKVSRTYDAVCLWDAIEHISDPCELMCRIRNLVKEDGYIFISTPNIGALFARILKSRWPFMTPPEHLCFFSKRSMQRLADTLDMELIAWKSKGKWANVGFILYKFNRVSSVKIPKKIIGLFQQTFLSKWKIYVPTCDVQYAVLGKKPV